MARVKRVGILTAGGDSPGPQRGHPRVRQGGHRASRDEPHRLPRRLPRPRRGPHRRLDARALSGILTVGGTILGTSRDKPHRMPMDGVVMDMTEQIVKTYQRAPARRSRVHRRQRHREEQPPAGQGRAQHRDAAQDHRQRRRGDRRDHRLRDLADDRHGGHRPPPQHRSQPPPDHPGRGHGPPGRLADAGGGHRRRRGRDPDPGDPLPHRERGQRHQAAHDVGHELLDRRRRRGRPGRRDQPALPGHGRAAQGDGLAGAPSGRRRTRSWRPSTPTTPATRCGSHGSWRRSPAWSRASRSWATSSAAARRRRSTACWPRGSATPGRTSSPGGRSG